jgi:hypothetical protein
LLDLEKLINHVMALQILELSFGALVCAPPSACLSRRTALRLRATE